VFSRSTTPLKRPAYIHLYFLPALLSRRYKTNALFVLNYKNQTVFTLHRRHEKYYKKIKKRLAAA
jgi:hypothetical protein